MTAARMIAIDGPAASGKSTLAEKLAAELGYLYFDTGVMYRAVTLAVLRAAISPEAEAEVAAIALGIEIDVQPPTKPDGRKYDVCLDGEDVTWEIHSPEVDANVSQVSIYAEVRQAMTRRQREIGLRGAVVMVGRDIGTVVLPEADLKLYVVASVEERARRRHAELLARGEQRSYPSVLEALQARDLLDSSRDLAPLKPARDALQIDTTSTDSETIFRCALSLARDLERAAELRGHHPSLEDCQ